MTKTKKSGAKSSKGPICGNAASGGVMVCVLAKGHPADKPHSNSTDRKGQYATWSSDGKGSIVVKSFSSGKPMGEWTETECAARCPALLHSPETKKPKKPEQRCELDDGHVGAHRTPAPEGHHMTVWAEGEHGSVHIPLSKYDDARDHKVEDEFDLTWRRLAEESACDSFGGGEYIRVRGEWSRAGGDPESFIRQRANATPSNGLSDLPELSVEEAESVEAHVVAVETPIVDRDIKPENIGGYPVHPAAALFPLITGAEFEAFVEDVRVNKQRTRIVLLNGALLDGRNRLRALIRLGYEPKFREFGSEETDGSDPIAFVVSENINGRRHLDETDRAYIGMELVPMYEAQAKERMLAGKRQDPRANLREGQKASEAAAKAVNVSPRTIEHALKVKRDADPEVLAASRGGGRVAVSAAAELAKLPKEKQREHLAKNKKITIGKARQLVRQEQKREIVHQINTGRVQPMPGGQFGVIYGDYPWFFDNSDQHEGSRGHMPYPGMEMPAILAHAREVAKRAGKHCLIVQWVVNAYIHEVGNFLAAFGATHRTMYTWPKPNWGIGTWGRGQTEHLLIASIGEPPNTLNEISTLLNSYPLREHSRKPDEVAELLLKHCGGPHLELFAREPREGWVTWGAEANGSDAFVREEPKKRSKILTATDTRLRAS